MRFIDLFAGLGGFHVGLRRLGHECVFASEIDRGLQELYKKNFGLSPAGDIREVTEADIPPHDILCAGFPCQPFSKAGEQQGFEDPDSGDLFDAHIMRVVKFHQPQYIILENVPNLEKHNDGQTWVNIMCALGDAGYEYDHHNYSPHHFGIPQIRDRIFIVASRSSLKGFRWPQRDDHPHLSINSILHKPAPSDAKLLSKQTIECLNVWQEFISMFPANIDLPTFPIWSMEYGADYPYEQNTPYATDLEHLRACRGCYGKSLSLLAPNATKEEVLQYLPPYARTDEEAFPEWKKKFIRQNRDFYNQHKSWIDGWLAKVCIFPPSLQKLEWNCKGGERDIWKYVIQFRASGVRVKKPTTAPSLIAMTTTQVPIIAWERRYMTPRECASLQCLAELPSLPKAPTKAFKALGNAVNARIVEVIAEALTAEHITAMSSVKNTNNIPLSISQKNESYVAA